MSMAARTFSRNSLDTPWYTVSFFSWPPARAGRHRAASPARHVTAIPFVRLITDLPPACSPQAGLLTAIDHPPGSVPKPAARVNEISPATRRALAWSARVVAQSGPLARSLQECRDADVRAFRLFGRLPRSCPD